MADEATGECLVGANVTEYGIRINLDGAAEATAGMNAVAASGDKVTASVAKMNATVSPTEQALIRQGAAAEKARTSYSNVATSVSHLNDAMNAYRNGEASLMDERLLRSAGLLRANATNWDELAASERSETEAAVENIAATSEQAAAHEVAAGAVTTHGVALGRVAGAVGSMDARMLGMSGTLGRFASSIGGATVGFGPMLVGMLAIGGAEWVWEKLTGGSKETAKAQDEASKSLKRFNDEARAGMGGKMAMDLKTVTDQLAKLKAEIDKTKIVSTPTYNAGGPGGSPFAGAGGVGLLDGLKAIFGMKTSADDAAKKVADVAKVVHDTQDNLNADFGKTTGAMALQIQRQNELNAAFGKGALAADLINHKFDYLEDVLKHSVGTTDAERKTLDALSASIRTQADEASRNATGWTETQRKSRELAADLPALTAAFDALPPSLTAVNIGLVQTVGQYDAVMSVQTMLIQKHDDIKKSLDQLAAKNKQTTDAQQTETARNIVAQQKAADEMDKIWADGFEKIFTNGLKSWNNFFGDVLQLFSKVMAQMRKDGNIFGNDFKALNVGSAGLTAGIAGYSVGSQIGSSAGGVGAGSLLTAGSSGATAGALAGTAILPGIGTAIGAIVGELTGVAGALISGAKAAKERKDTEDQLRTSLLTSVNAMRVLAGVASPLSQSLLENAAAFKKLRDDNDAAFAGTKNQAQRESQLAEINGLEAIRIQQLKDDAAALHGSFMNDLEVRNLRAHGMSAEADAMADTIARGKELQDAIKQFGASSEEVATLMKVQAEEMANAAFAAFSGKNQAAFAANLQAMNDKIAADNAARDALKQIAQDQLNVAQEQLDVVTKSLDLQKKAVDSLRATVDALHKQSDSLKLSTLSPLSANDRYNEAKSQYDILSEQVAAGDQTKIGDFTAAQTAWLTESRAMFGSSGRYAQDFAQAQAFNATLTDHFETQLSTEEQILAVLQSQSNQLNAQIALLNAQLHQSAYDAALARQVYVVGGPKDPNFLVQNGVAGATTGLPPWDPMSPTGQALAIAMGLGGGSAGPRDTSEAAYSAWIKKVNGDSGRSAQWGTSYDEWMAQGSPAFARGGMFGGGLRLVGERGPELEATGPSRVMTAAQINQPVVDELRALRAEVAELRADNRRDFTENTRAVRAKREKAGSN